MLPPRINDITTDVDDPPAIEGRKPLPERFKKIIREGYPDLKPLDLEEDQADVFRVGLELAQKMRGWTITHVEEEQRSIQGFATTVVMRFVDDFVIRFREHDGGTRVDMRSKSRVGIGDLGANAKRIRAYFRLLVRELESVRGRG